LVKCKTISPFLPPNAYPLFNGAGGNKGKPANGKATLLEKDGGQVWCF